MKAKNAEMTMNSLMMNLQLIDGWTSKAITEASFIQTVINDYIYYQEIDELDVERARKSLSELYKIEDQIWCYANEHKVEISTDWIINAINDFDYFISDLENKILKEHEPPRECDTRKENMEMEENELRS